jgi:hypothetical protein
MQRQACSARPLHPELYQEPNEKKHQADAHYRQDEPHQVLADENSKLKAKAQQAVARLKEHADALNRANVRIKALNISAAFEILLVVALGQLAEPAPR